MKKPRAKIARGGAPTKRARVTVSVDRFGKGRFTINGQDISNDVMGFKIEAYPHEFALLTFTLLAELSAEGELLVISDDGYDVSLFSSSEKLRVMIAILEAFATMGGCRIGVVDNFEILSPANRRLFAEFITETQDTFETLICLGTWTNKTPPVQAPEGVGLYHWTHADGLERIA